MRAVNFDIRGSAKVKWGGTRETSPAGQACRRYVCLCWTSSRYSGPLEAEGIIKPARFVVISIRAHGMLRLVQ